MHFQNDIGSSNPRNNGQNVLQPVNTELESSYVNGANVAIESLACIKILNFGVRKNRINTMIQYLYAF